MLYEHQAYIITTLYFFRHINKSVCASLT